MRAVVYKGPKEVAIEEVDDPKIENPRDGYYQAHFNCHLRKRPSYV